jgi:DNA-binding transcriptional ArsR family regulator
LLAVHARRPFQISAAIGLSRPATSRQLQLLADARLIRVTPSPIDGRGVLYGLDPATHGAITAWLAGTGFGGRVGLVLEDDWRVRVG